MTATWSANSQGVAFAATKSMLDVFNGGSSTRVIRCYAVFGFNAQTSGVTGVVTTLRIRRITDASGGSSVTPVKHDTNSSALNANTTAGTNRTTTAGDIFRQQLFSTEEITTTGTGINSLMCIAAFAELMSPGLGDSSMEPIFCRPGYGLELYHSGSTTVGTLDPEIIFTDAAS